MPLPYEKRDRGNSCTIELSSDVVGLFDYIEGDTPERKISNLVDDNLLRRLRECEEEIYKFEVKHRMPFSEFKQAWEKDEIPDKYSHQIERDYMIWEGLEVEKKKWLSLMKRLENR